MKHSKPISYILVLIIILSVSLLFACSSQNVRDNITSAESTQGETSSLDLEISQSDNWALVIKTNSRVFYFRYGEGLDSEEAAIDFTTNFLNGEKQIMEKLHNDLGDMSNSVEVKYQEKISFEIDLSGTRRQSAHADSHNNIVYLYSTDDLAKIFHEFNHILLGDSQSAWISEAAAEYCSMFVSAEYFDKTWWQRISDALINIDTLYQEASQKATASHKEELEAEYKIMQDSVKIYSANKDLPLTGSDLDYELFMVSLGAACLQNPSHTPLVHTGIIGTTVSQGKSASDKKHDPNDLNYPEAYIIMKYLVDVYDAKTVYAYYSGQMSFETAFGSTYTDMFPSIIQWLETEYRY